MDNYNAQELYKKKIKITTKFIFSAAVQQQQQNPRRAVEFSILILAIQQMQDFNSPEWQLQY